MLDPQPATFRHVVWEGVAEPGLELLSLHEGDEVRVDSLVVFQLGGEVARLRYRVSLTPDWRVRTLNVELNHGGDSRSLTLEHGEAGDWTLDGQLREDLAGCTEIDLEASPFTNTLPIRRLAFAPDEAKVIRVAYVAFPSLAVTAAAQEYTRLGDTDPPARFRYRSLSSGFTAEVAVDAAGLVEDYPGYWRRRL